MPFLYNLIKFINMFSNNNLIYKCNKLKNFIISKEVLNFFLIILHECK